MKWPAVQAPFQGQCLGLVICLDPDAKEAGARFLPMWAADFLVHQPQTDGQKALVSSCVYEDRERSNM